MDKWTIFLIIYGEISRIITEESQKQFLQLSLEQFHKEFPENPWMSYYGTSLEVIHRAITGKLPKAFYRGICRGVPGAIPNEKISLDPFLGFFFSIFWQNLWTNTWRCLKSNSWSIPLSKFCKNSLNALEQLL